MTITVDTWHTLDGRGVGPSTTAQDGTPLALATRVAPDREVSLIRPLLTPGTRLLDLGGGTGRVGRPLVGDIADIVTVDQSATMLAHVDFGRPTLASIETLRLGEAFDLVLLLSDIINTPHAAQRAAFLRTVRAHLAIGGRAVIERMNPWYLEAPFDCEQTEADGKLVKAAVLDRLDGGAFRLNVSVAFPGEDVAYEHHVTVVNWVAPLMDAELHTAHLRLVEFLDEDECTLLVEPVALAG